MGEDILMTFQDVLSFTGAELLQGNTDLPIKGVCTDTRTIQNGDLFIALPGARFHGDDFAHKALEKGAVAVLVSGKPHQISMKKASIAIVSDGLKALWALAKGYRSKLDIPLIAITGSSGKTTTKDMLYTILNDQYPVFRTFQNFNNHIGVCLSILQIRNHHRVACLELGSNAPGEIDALASLVKPDIGIILNVGPTHLEKLRDLEGVCREKTDLFRHAKRGVYNKDDVVLEAHISRGEFNARSFGIYQGGDVRATGIEVCDDCTTQFNLIIDQNECGLVRIPVPGIHQVYNALAAICAAELLKVDRSLMIESCQRVELPKMRMEMKEEKGITVINDAYNANPQSMKAALEVLKTLKVKGRRFFVCADMMELGDSAQTQHRHLGEIIPDYGVYCLVTFGENAELTSLACKSKGSAIVKHVYHATGKELISAYLLEMLQPGDAVLVKGSRAMCMDEVADALLRRLKNMQDHQTADDYTNVS